MENRQYSTLLRKVADVNASVKNISKLLYGNGETGLCEKVRNLEKIYRIGPALLLGLNILLTVIVLLRGFIK
jgi:hypothetical protein